MQTKVWLLRHAETAAPHLFQGAESDIELSEYGHRQAEVVAQLFAAMQPDAVISSAMRRAITTATPIAQACNLQLEIEPELHERRVGALTGTPHSNSTVGLWPDTLRRWVNGDTAYAPPDSESFEAIQNRVLPVWARVTARHEGRSIVIVAHGIICRVLLLSLIEGWGAADWDKIGRVPNLATSELVGEGRSWKALRMSEVPPAVLALPRPSTEIN